jgi:diguanylate cyclase (GGDEF)-like protein/PAS domain S-box-containing protein
MADLGLGFTHFDGGAGGAASLAPAFHAGNGSDTGGRLDEYLEGTTDCVYLLDAEWRFTYVNGRAQTEIAGGRQLLGLCLWTAFPECRGSIFEEHYRKAMELRVQGSFEAYFGPLESWYDVAVSPLSSGGLGVWFRNINERKAADAERAAVVERYRLATQATNDLVWDWDLVTGDVEWNDALGARFGYNDYQLGTGAHWWLSRVHPDDRERVEQEIHECTAGSSERFLCEYRFRRSDGSYAEVLDRGFVIRDTAGRGIRMVGAMQDNSARNEAARAIAEREAQLATVFGQAMVGIMHCTPDARPLMANERFCRILGRSEEELKGCAIFEELTSADDMPWNKPLYEKHLAEARPFQIEKRYIRPDGSAVWCEVAVSFIRGASGAVESCIVVAQDISARKAAEAALASQSSLLQNVVDSVADLIFVKDKTGRFLLANRALTEGCGDLVGLRTTDLFPDDLTPTYEDIDREVIETGALRTVDEEIPVHGERRLFHTVKVPWVRDGEIAGIIGVSRDITERKAAEETLRQSETLYRSVLEASADCIKIMDLDGRLELMNEPGLAVMELSGLDAVRGKSWAELWPAEARDTVRAALLQAAGGTVARFTGFCPTAGGTPKYWDVLVSPMCGADGTVDRILSISRDITSQRETAEQLRWASEHDALTGLPNRRAFQAHLQAATIRAMESGGMIGLLLMDLDHFKHVNDTLGHSAGDHLLATFGKRLKDTVRKGDFVGRLGGDEFAVILEGVKAEEDLLRAGESILRRLKAPIRYNGRVLAASASIGGAVFPRDAQNAHELFNNADTALYALKESGRGGTRMFHQLMRDQAQKIASQISLARFAVSEDAVVPHYQPKVDLLSGATIGFEALLRWRHPSRGLQVPDTVAEAFKDYELASQIGEMMQKRVFADMRRWLNEGLEIGSVAINASPAEFLRDDFAERLLARLEQQNVPPHLVELEVTEHVFLDRGSDYVGRALKRLDAAGVRIALDDFGTGYSSLSHLRDFPVDVVKIDRSFVARMREEPEIGAIVSAVIQLAASLSVQVVAEGVETEAQREALLAKGCSVAQGFLFGRAAEADEVRHLLLRRPL